MSRHRTAFTMNSEEYSNRFEKLYKLFSEAYLNFFVWKGLQDKMFEEVFSENSGFWNSVLFSLESCWLTQLAKIYESSSYSKKSEVISVYALLPHQKDLERASLVTNILDRNGEVIQNIQRLRDNQLAHNNAKHLQKPSVILSKFPIKYADVEGLLSATGEILSNLHPATGHGYAYAMLAGDAENDGRRVVKKLQYYSKLHREHLEKFRRGEVGSPHFGE
jgi:hypothetical protein